MPNSNIAICHAITPQIAPHHPIFRPTEQLTHVSRKTRQKINNISLKIFKTLFFKIYNPTFNKVHIPDKTRPTTNLNTTLKHLSHVLPYSHRNKKVKINVSRAPAVSNPKNVPKYYQCHRFSLKGAFLCLTGYLRSV